MIAAWPPLREALFGRWQPSDPDKEYASPWGEGWKMTIGDWINLRAGETFDIDIAVGECPGGHVSSLLLVEEKKVEYAHGADGRPILPIFTTEPVIQENQDHIDRDFAKSIGTSPSGEPLIGTRLSSLVLRKRTVQVIRSVEVAGQWVTSRSGSWIRIWIDRA